LSNSVSREMHFILSQRLGAKQDKKEACTLFLTTRGGDPDGGYRIARCLRHHYKHLRIAIPSDCKSAGTLIAIAADELAIGDFGELGPLDIQVKKGTELREQSSGLDIMQALQAVTSHNYNSFHQILSDMRDLGLATKLSAEFAAQVSSGVSSPLFAQIDPLRMGEMQRAISVAIEYGKRLNAYGKNLKPGALDRLVGEYPSHSFVIDRKEAAELFERVSHLSKEENDFATDWWFAVGFQGSYPPQIFDRNLPTQGNDSQDNTTEPGANHEALQNTTREGAGTNPEINAQQRNGRQSHGQDNVAPDDEGLRIIQGGGA
jgi:Serine dehydrogenase proteinase